MAEDYYKTLGVSKNASASEIQAAYRSLARKHHPDLNPDDKDAKRKFQEVQTAFDVLNDPSKRELYDRYGSSFESMGAGGGPRTGSGPWEGVWTGGAGGTPEDIDISQIFGGGGGGFADVFNTFRRASSGRGNARGAAKKGNDLETEVTIPFTIAVLGGETHLALSRAGHVENLVVKIPAGIDEGKKIRLRGQGEPGRRGNMQGDLLITVHVAPHPFFTRRGNDLTVKLPVTLEEAALGAKVDVPTPHGTISLRLPPGTSSGAKLRAKEHGVRPHGIAAGDLYAEIQIILPKAFDPRAQELVRQLAAECYGKTTPNPRQDLRW